MCISFLHMKNESEMIDKTRRRIKVRLVRHAQIYGTNLLISVCFR